MNKYLLVSLIGIGSLNAALTLSADMTTLDISGIASTGGSGKVLLTDGGSNSFTLEFAISDTFATSGGISASIPSGAASLQIITPGSTNFEIEYLNVPATFAGCNLSETSITFGKSNTDYKDTVNGASGTAIGTTITHNSPINDLYIVSGSTLKSYTTTISNFSATYEAVPEPSTTLLLGLGGLYALNFRKRKA